MTSDTTEPFDRSVVGLIGDLDEVQAASIYYLRMWFDGPASQAEVWNDLAVTLGAEEGAKVLKSFESLTNQIIRFAHQPLMRHSVQCKCVSADESVYSSIVAAASEGEQQKAEEFASVLVRPDIAPSIAILAGKVGMGLRLVMHAKNTPQEFAVPPSKYLH